MEARSRNQRDGAKGEQKAVVHRHRRRRSKWRRYLSELLSPRRDEGVKLRAAIILVVVVVLAVIVSTQCMVTRSPI